MIRHIVLFEFVKEIADRQAKIAAIRNGLLSLKDKIEIVRNIEVSYNENPAESFDIALIVDVDSMDHLAMYAQHPEHLKVGALIGEIKAGRACVDFTV